MINMMALYIIGTLFAIMLIIGYFYRVYENTQCKKEGIKQDKCPNFKEPHKFYYLIKWWSILDKNHPFSNNVYSNGDVSQVRKIIKKLRKRYGATLNYVVYEQRDLTDFIDWE